MCDQTEVQYLPGEIVWVKLRALWWPGIVQDYDSLPDEITSSFRKRPLATVKFFQEESYEYVHKLDVIYHYNCSRKNEFIKKGLDLTRKKSADRPSNMDLFPSDVATAEALTGGDPNIIEDDAFKPEQKPKYESLFGGEKKRVGKKKGKDDTPLKDKSLRRLKFSSTPPAVGWLSRGSSPNIIRPPPNIPRVITHPRFLAKAQSPNGKSDYEVRILIQKTNDDDANLSEKEYQCCMCGYHTCRLNVIILHFNTTHTSKIDSSLPRPKISRSRSSRPSLSKMKTEARKSDFSKTTSSPKKLNASQPHEESMEVSYVSDEEVAEAEASKIKSVKKDEKPSKRGRKRKIKDNVDEDDPKKPKVVDTLLAEWEEDAEEEQVEMEKEKERERLRKEEEDRIAAEAEAATAAATASKSKEVFEFDDDDDAMDLDLTPNVKGFGRRIPRVIDSAKGKRQTASDIKKSAKSKQGKKGSNDLLGDVDSILAETSVPSLPSIPKSSTFSLDVDLDEGNTEPTVVDETVSQESQNDLPTSNVSSVEESTKEPAGVSSSEEGTQKANGVSSNEIIGEEVLDNSKDSKNCSPEVELAVGSTDPPQGDADTSTAIKVDAPETAVDEVATDKVTLKGSRSPKPVGTGQSTGGGDHNYVIGESSSRRRRRSLLPIERNDELDILSMPVVWGDDFSVEQTPIVSRLSVPPTLPGSESHTGRKRRGRTPNLTKAAAASSKSRETLKRAPHHSSRSSKTPPVALKRSKSPVSKVGVKSPQPAVSGPKSPAPVASPKSPPPTVSQKSPPPVIDSKISSPPACPKSPASGSTVASGPKSPSIFGPKSPVSSAGPKSPPMSSPKSPIPTGPKSPPLTNPKSPPSTAPKSPLLTIPKSPPATGPKSPPPTGPKSPLSIEPKSPPPAATPSPVKNSSNSKVSKSPRISEVRGQVHVKSPKGSPLSQGSKTPALVLSPKPSPTSSPSKSASSHTSLVTGTSSKVVCVPNTSAADIFSSPKISLPGSVSPPPLVLTTPGKSSAGVSSAQKTASGTGSIKTIKVSVSGTRGGSPLLMQKAGSPGSQPRKLMIVQGKAGSSQKMLVPGSQRVIMQDMSGKKIFFLTKGSGNLVLSPQQQQKIMSPGGKISAGAGQISVGKGGASSPASKELAVKATASSSSPPLAGGSSSPPALVKTDGKKTLKIIKSTLSPPQGGSKGNIVLNTNSGQILLPVSSFAASSSGVLSTTSTAGGSSKFVIPVGTKIMKGKSGSGKMVLQMQSSQSKLMLPSKAGPKSPQVKFITQPSQSPRLTSVPSQAAAQLQTVSPSVKAGRPKLGGPSKQMKGPMLPKSLKKLSVASKPVSQSVVSTGDVLIASGGSSVSSPKSCNIVQVQPKSKQISGVIPNSSIKGTTQIQSKVPAGIKKTIATQKVPSTEASVASIPDGGNVQVVSNIPVSLEQIQSNLLAAATPSDTGSTVGLSTPTQQIVTVSTEDGGQLMYLIDNSALLGLDGANQAADGSPRTLIIDPSQGNLGNLILAFDNVAQPSVSASDFSFPTPSSGQDILAEALANTQVLQPDTSGNDLTLDTSLLSSHSGNALYQSNVPTLSHGVLETSLTLNQPIMTPLQDLSAVSSLQPPPVSSTSLDLPITITQPDITISTSSYSSLPIPSATIQNTVFSDAQQVSSYNSTVPILATEADSDSGSAFIESAVPEGESFVTSDNTFETPTESASMPLLDTP